jgi:serine/threonine protein kinase
MVQHKTHISTDWKWGGDAGVFQMEEVLGKGASGIVLKAKVRDIGFDVAIKKVKQSNKRVQEELEKEIEVLKKCKHVNIVAYYGTKIEKDDVWIIMVSPPSPSRTHAPHSHHSMHAALLCIGIYNCRIIAVWDQLKT